MRIGGFNYYYVLVDVGLCFGFFITSYASYYSFRVAKRITATNEKEVTWIPLISNCTKKSPVLEHQSEKLSA